MRIYELEELLERVRTDIGRKEYVEALNKMDDLCVRIHNVELVCDNCRSVLDGDEEML